MQVTTQDSEGRQIIQEVRLTRVATWFLHVSVHVTVQCKTRHANPKIDILCSSSAGDTEEVHRLPELVQATGGRTRSIQAALKGQVPFPGEGQVFWYVLPPPSHTLSPSVHYLLYTPFFLLYFVFIPSLSLFSPPFLSVHFYSSLSLFLLPSLQSGSRNL